MKNIEEQYVNKCYTPEFLANDMCSPQKPATAKS